MDIRLVKVCIKDFFKARASEGVPRVESLFGG
jgi:hypothetical protein